MKFRYFGVKPDVDGTGFEFRVDGVASGHDDVALLMDFLPELQAGQELIAVPEYTPPGWVFKQLESGELGLRAVYEPIRESIDPRDESPRETSLRVYIIKTVKQEYIEDERKEG